VAAIEPAVSAAPAPVRESHVLSPLVRRLAEREHVDLEVVHGSGVGGMVTRADVESVTHRRRVSPRARRLAAERGIDLDTVDKPVITGDDLGAAPTVEPEAPKRSRQETMQQRTAALMERSNREIPHFYLTLDCEISAVTMWLAQRNFGVPPRERIVPAAVVITAVSRAAAEVAGFNGWWQDGAFVPSPTVDLGMVVALRGGGLLVPVIAGANTLTVSEVMPAMYDVVERARSGHLRSAELAQPSITVSSLGDQGADAVFGVIYPPQVALVGVGRVVERPWAQDGLVGARPVIRLTLAADHRVSDGHQGSRFLGAVERMLRTPDILDKRQPT
jgi:pyruvate dehydrogenase E2 component (dihydrolipoamide acetyltransferase)